MSRFIGLGVRLLVARPSDKWTLLPKLVQKPRLKSSFLIDFGRTEFLYDQSTLYVYMQNTTNLIILYNYYTLIKK